MNERVKFIARYLQNEEPFLVLCENAGISRKTGYKWGERYDEGGVVALVDRSRAPRSHPHAVDGATIEAIVARRRRHPRWGPRKLLVILRRREPRRAWRYLTNCLAGELVGLEEVDDDRWKVYFGPIELGVLDARNAKARGDRQFGLLVRTDGTILSRRRRRLRRR